MANKELIDVANKLIECFNKNDPNNLDQFDQIMDANVKYQDLSVPEKPKNL